MKPEGYSYLGAARRVLERYGKPMHYATIALVATRLRLLKTESPNAALHMGVAINQDIQKQKGESDFVRVRRGVFDLRSGGLGTIVLGDCQQLHARVARLAAQMTRVDAVGVLARALWIARICEKVRGEWRVLLVGSKWLTMDPALVCEEGMTRFTEDKDLALGSPVRLTRPLAAGYRDLGRLIGVDTVTAVAFAVSLLERFLDLADGGRLVVQGPKERSENIWVGEA